MVLLTCGNEVWRFEMMVFLVEGVCRVDALVGLDWIGLGWIWGKEEGASASVGESRPL